MSQPPKFGPQLNLDMSSSDPPPQLPADLAFKLSKIQEAQAMISKKWRELEHEASKLGYKFPEALNVVLFNIEINSDFLQLILRAETLAGRVHYSDPTGNDPAQDGRQTPNLRLVGSVPGPDGKT